VKILKFFDADPVSGRGKGGSGMETIQTIQKEASVDSATNNSKLPVKVGADNINNNLGTTKT
jgi:hypothetical protein